MRKPKKVKEMKKLFAVVERMRVPGYRDISFKGEVIGSMDLHWLDATVDALNAYAARGRGKK